MAWRKPNSYQGIYIEKRVFDSPAFMSLNASEIKVLFRFLRKREIRKVGKPSKRQGKVIANNGEITFSYEEAVGMGFCKQTFSAAIKGLVKAGFISVADHGGLSQGGEKRSTKYTVNVMEGQVDPPWAKYKPEPPKYAAPCPENLKQHRTPSKVPPLKIASRDS